MIQSTMFVSLFLKPQEDFEESHIFFNPLVFKKKILKFFKSVEMFRKLITLLISNINDDISKSTKHTYPNSIPRLVS